MKQIDNLVNYLKNRKTLLWIIKETTDFQTLDDINELAQIRWEAIWTQSTTNRFYDYSEQIAKTLETNPEKGKFPRQPYRFSADPDKIGDLDRRSFLPIYETEGSSRETEVEGRWDIGEARRSLYRFNQYRKLEIFDGHVLLVTGVQESNDIDKLKDALEFAPYGMDVYVIWPNIEKPTWQPPNGTKLTFIDLSISDLINLLKEEEIPRTSSFAYLSVRYGTEEIELSEREISTIINNFHLVQTKDLYNENDGSNINISEELKKLDSFQDDWSPFSKGVIYKRNYKPLKNGETELDNYLKSSLDEIYNNSDDSNFTLRIPATSGSGITTTIRDTAYKIARLGYPVLVCRTGCHSISIEAILAFLTLLRNRSNSDSDYPALIIFDREHLSLEFVNNLASNLDSRGRKAVVVQIVPPTAVNSTINDYEELDKPKGVFQIVNLFRGEVEQKEIEELCTHFQQFIVDAPTIDDWKEYQKKNRFVTSNTIESEGSLFWVALKFFLGSENTDDDYSRWIFRVCEENIENQQIKRALKHIAALSVFGIPIPLTILMRSLGTGNAIDSSIVGELHRLCENEEILEWYPHEEVIQDQAISFKHRLVSSQYLRSIGIDDIGKTLEQCRSIIQFLNPSSVSDNWLIDTLVFEALRPGRHAEKNQLILIQSLYQEIPSVIATRNQSIQHHWARVLYQLASDTDESDMRYQLLRDAVAKLTIATNLPPINRRREHPRNIFNSLGVILTELSKYYREIKDIKNADISWDQAASAFEKAMGFDADNLIVLSAYASRLLEHGRINYGKDINSLTDISSAITYIDRSLEIPGISHDDDIYINNLKYEAYQLIDVEEAKDFLESIKEKNIDLWAIISAQKILRNLDNRTWIKGEARELDEAWDILNKAKMNIPFVNWQLNHLLYKITTNRKKSKWDFEYRLNLLNQLAETNFKWDSKLAFARCVLHYQCKNYDRGRELFIELRNAFNTGLLEVRGFSAFLRNDEPNQMKPQPATIRITRKDTPWRGYGEVQELKGQRILVRPRWFDIPPEINEIRPCYIQFGPYGPIAVPQNRNCTSNID